ncbi:odorant receptor 4-like [Toxorhynchites rutilus septentrionalis]|uniref:odorant receptor 4-like n=1 Tax=Toxorhynchites rutilus septentrionalis TaxID=329112 RepID=UPI002478C144|nr:odorant receptor 4-like [Toxorhynchites rutilus septentrionalis]
MDFEDTFAFTIKVQKAYGSRSCFEPYSGTVLMLIRSHLAFVAVVLMLFYHLFGEVCYLVKVTTNKQFETETGMVEESAGIIARSGFTLFGLIKVLVLAYDRNLLADILGKLRTNWMKQVQLNRSCRDFYERSFGSVVKITTYAAITNVAMVSLFNIVPILEMTIETIQTGNCTRILPYTIWYPFDAISGWWFYLVYIFEVVSASFVAVANSGFNSMFCLLAVHLSTQIRLLGRSLERIIRTEADAYKMPRPNLADVVRCHEELLEYKKAIGTIFGGTTFLVFAGASIVICLQGIIMTTSSGTDAIKFFLFFVSILLEIFFLCYYGDEIMQSSNEIGSAVYRSLWYEVEHGGDARFRKSLIPIIVRSQKPVVLMAWLFWPITINTFGMANFKNILVIFFAFKCDL